MHFAAVVLLSKEMLKQQANRRKKKVAQLKLDVQVYNTFNLVHTHTHTHTHTPVCILGNAAPSPDQSGRHLIN